MNFTSSFSSLPLKRLFFAFLVSVLAVGAYWWRPSYNEIQLVPSWWVFALISLVIAAVFASRDLQKSMLAGAAVVGGVIASILIRVILDVVDDPTSHNLWPLEVAIAGAIVVPFAVLGAAFGMLARRVLSRS